MIKCDRHRALIPESTCIARQRIIQKANSWNTHQRVASLEIQYACKGCEIGEKLLRGESVMEHQKTKICRVCGQEKSVVDFHKSKNAIDMISAILSLCPDLTPFQAHCFGTEIKYRFRAGLKGDPVEDIGKAMKYLEFREGA
jgi:hypothetical protein